MDFKDQWDLEAAMKVLEHKTVDSKLWAEAVEWLMLYGPPEIQKLLMEASAHATATSFPELQPTGYTADGQPMYDVAYLAKELGISEDEVRIIIEEKEKQHKEQSLIQGTPTTIH